MNSAVTPMNQSQHKKQPDLPPGYASRSYATRKTVAEGLLDFALLMANASQLKAVLDIPSGPLREGFWLATLVLLALSITLQVVTGVIIFILGTMEIHTNEEQSKANSLNNASVALIMFISVLNVFVTAFGIKYATGAAS